MVIGVLEWLWRGHHPRAWLNIVLGPGCWINAWSVRAGWNSKRRWVAVGAYLVVAGVAIYVVR